YVVSERSSIKKCGYPRCKNQRIDSIEFCSETCMNAINELLTMLRMKSMPRSMMKEKKKKSTNAEKLHTQEKPRRLQQPPSPYYDIDFGSSSLSDDANIATLEHDNEN